MQSMLRLGLVLGVAQALTTRAGLRRSAVSMSAAPVSAAPAVEEPVVAAPVLDKLRFLTAPQALEVREKFGTPCFVYDAASLRARAAEAMAFPASYGLTVRYAMKACPNAAVLRLFLDAGLHFDASSTHECRRAMHAGIPANKISLSTQQLDGDFVELLKMGVMLNACSLQQVEQFANAMPGAKLGLRFNPGLGSGGTSKTNVGGAGSSFGIWHGEVEKCMDWEAKGLIHVERIHTHIGSGSNPEVWQKVSKMSLDLCAKFPGVEALNLGGGYKIARMAYEKSTVLATVGAPVAAEFEAFAKATGRQLRLEIEPGTYLVANAGALVTSAQDVISTRAGEPQGRDFIKLDCGMTEVMRPSLYGAQHPIVVVPGVPRVRGLPKEYVVVGHCCESGDLLTPAPDEPETLAVRALDEAKAGDVVVIESVGAYCAAMCTKHYNSFPEAPEVMLSTNGEMHCIRRRSSLDQIIMNEVPVDAAALL
ncbi:hypothetical protein M885DRAFT_512460 [Pelagophyceae sp. CCMP2097]|nr:hypothetical protein M885DRAFT_512460 [Pelagophyceae sp. CCMP2097]|mmetsp:Transcript_6943/g.22524  ORF Transcript_6943/g.22524 Transcript_6943/m.22524 type:complete len:479 (+) Transcript_6943:51-1487(+)